MTAQPVGAIRTVAFGTIEDAIFSRDGSKLFVAQQGKLTAYDVATGASTGSWTLGHTLGGLDVSVDGRYVVAVEREAPPFTGVYGQENTTNYAIYRVDLQTGGATTYQLPKTGYYTYPFFDAAFLPDGKVLLSTAGDWSPLTTYDFAGNRSDGSLALADRPTLTASRDHTTIAVLAGDISDAPVAVYTHGSGITAQHENYADGVMGYNNGAQAISPDGTVIVQGAGFHFYNNQAQYQGTLSTTYPFASGTSGLAFSPDGDKLYVLDRNSDHIFVLDADTRALLTAYPVLADALYPNVYGDSLQVSADGKFALVIVDGGVQLIDLSRVVADGGTNGADSLVASADHLYLYGFGGNDTLDSGSVTTGVQMYGGAGDDTYIVRYYNDYVTETVAAEGTDTVISYRNFYTLPYLVEKLTLAGPTALYGNGNGQANLILGNDFGNTVSGLEGDDTLNGYGGDDRVDGGTDNDVLDGGDGNDTLTGGSGADTLTGGTGADTFSGTLNELNGDRITDFGIGDRIVISDRGFADFTFSHSGSSLIISNRSIDIGSFAGPLKAVAEGNGTVIVAATDIAQDFNGDGHSDILWRHSNGAVSTWQIAGDGTQVQQSTFNASVDPSWRIVETGDFNGDGLSDLLWRHAGGMISVWNALGGGNIAQGGYTDGSVGNDWRIAGVGDLNGDGKDDLLWQHQSGAVSSWNATGSGFQQNSYYHGSVGADWKVVGLADFNGDGRADLAWRNDNGGVATWLSSAGGINDGGFFTGVPSSWHIDGLGDFNGDGRSDILWRNDNGALSLWRSNGDGFDQGVYNTSVSNDWHVDAVGDFNGDGKADILWRNDNGALSTWQSNGGGFTQAVYNNVVDHGWDIVDHDFPL
jgi:YVTN family beta-propeller protein